MRLDFCGVRGSTPAPGVEFAGVGGHTSCVAISHDGAAPSLVLDAGTGLRRLSTLLAGAPFRGTILLSHLHWDHTHGLPFFTAGDREDSSVRLLLPEQEVDPLELLARCMSPPHFPIRPDELRGDWSFGSLAEGAQHLEGFTVLAREIPHKGGRTFGFRISDGSGTVAYLSDHAPQNLGDGPDGVGEHHPAACELVEGVDVLIHDGQYTAEELPTRGHFGHAAAEYAAGLAQKCGAGRLVLFHHDPAHTDWEVEALRAGVQEHPAGAGVAVGAGREGDVLLVPGQ
ncbi:MAG TPA: MBL fold metallo-hydrolase [Acidimicrobiales bacterium]|nr:MBL fold metallo-hydrolase [Acidimicrobiales bacterium]